jgi:hypothetical protein
MYKLTNDEDVILRLSDSACIPKSHRWWSEYEQWLAAGNTPAPREDTSHEEARTKRNQLLRDCDWTQIADNNLTAADRLAFAAYRQLLRDLPQRPGFPAVQWPTPPLLGDDAGNDLPEQS